MKLCECGCGKEIIMKSHHSWYGMPRFIRGHNTLGTTRTEKTKKQMGEIRLALWQDPEFAKMTIESMNRPEVRKKRSEALIGIPHSEEIKRKEREIANLPEAIKKKREANLGEKNPNYIDGLSNLPYPVGFNDQLKERVRERDNHICQKCGRTEVECLFLWNQVLHIHHIDYEIENLSDENLISLCLSCNSRVNTNREYWTPFFQKKILAFEGVNE